MKQAAKQVDTPWRKSRLLLRNEAGPLRPRDRALARQLANDPGVSNRLIQQALYFLGIGPRKHEFDKKLVGRRDSTCPFSQNAPSRN